MCGGRDQWNSHHLIGLLIVCLLACSCAAKDRNTGETDYEKVRLLLRRGNLSEALSAAEKGVVFWQNQPDSPDYWKYKILKAEVIVSQGRSKDALALLETPLPAGNQFDKLVSRFRIVKVKCMLRLGRTDEARTLLDEAESSARHAGDAASLPEIQIQRGNLLTILNRPSEGEAAFEAGLKSAEDQNDLYSQTVALNNLGFIRIRQIRYDEAIPFLERAEAGFRKIGANLFAAIALANLGLCAHQLGDFDRALANYAKAIEVQEKEGAKLYLQASVGEVGNVHALQNDFPKAIPYYLRALRLALDVNALSDASKWAGNLSQAFINVEDWDQADKFNQQSRELKERIKDTDSLIYSRLNTASIAAGRGETSKALQLFAEVIQAAAKDPRQLWESHARLGAFYRKLGDNAKASMHFEAAIRAIEASRSELTLGEYRITFLSRLIRFYQDYVDTLVDLGADDKALHVAESSRSRVLAERLRRGKDGRIAPVTADYTKTARQAGTVFLEYWLAPKRSFLWVVTPRGRKQFVLPPQAEIESLVKSYAAIIQDLRDPLDFPPVAAARLYDILLAPARDLIPGGSKVVLVPDGVLHNLNFETLLVPDKTPHYWIEDVTLSVAPFIAARAADTPAAPEKAILVIGDPAENGENSRRLPYAASEIRAIGERMNALQKVVYEGAAAQPAVYRAADPGRFSIIHFAAHAVANRENPLESAILLSQANQGLKLYAREVMQLPLTAELVTISACRGAGARVYSGEGLVGFAWAFLQAGAHNVVAGLWDVTDGSTARLMDRLYAEIASGRPPVDALRLAKLSLIHSQSNFRKPYYWGPFQLYAGGL
jgi:CHAT domain-containing protein/Tfp pilus assembly protein PilF